MEIFFNPFMVYMHVYEKGLFYGKMKMKSAFLKTIFLEKNSFLIQFQEHY